MNSNQPTQSTETSDFNSLVYNLSRIHSERNFKQTHKPSFDALAPIETRILACIAMDMIEQEIGAKLSLALTDVRNYRKSVENNV